MRTRDQVAETLLHFFGERGDEICVQLAERLRAIRHGIEHSEFFKSHEVHALVQDGRILLLLLFYINECRSHVVIIFLFY